MNDDQLTANRLTDRMQDVLDGTASRADTDALHARLAYDAVAAEEFAAWTAMFDGLSSLSMVHPPEGLVAAIDSALPRDSTARVSNALDASEEIFSNSFQLFPDESVISSGITQTTRRPFGFKTMSSWLMPASSRESRHMNTQRKVLAGGAAAIVALGLAAVLSGYPPKSTDVVGTVVPAERYRAPQAGAEAVKLGDQAASPTSIESSQVASQAEAAAQADRISRLSEADRAALLSTADRASRLSEADRAAMFAAADRMSKLNEADRNALLSTADRTSKLSEADRNALLNTADRMSKLSEADRAAAFNVADKASRLSEADRAAMFAAADKMSKLSEADKMSKLSEADRSSRLSAADKSSKLNEADKMSKLSEADKMSKLSEADKMSKLNAADKSSK